MKPCPACGERIQDAARKCRHCGEMLASSGESRRGNSSNSTAIIWIVVAVAAGGLLIGGGCLAALLLPAVQQARQAAASQAREAARSSQCKNNVKMIGMALHNYHEVYGSFPPAYLADEDGRPMHSWRVLILPFVDQQFLYSQYDFSQPWDSPANQGVLDNMPPVFACPSVDASQRGNTTSYAGVFGPNCIFTGAEAIRIRDITDGTSNTLLIGEVEGAGIPWTKPEDIDVTIHPTIGDPAGFQSKHVGGVHFLMGDGSVRFVSENIGQGVLDSLFTRNGGEVIGEF